MWVVIPRNWRRFFSRLRPMQACRLSMRPLKFIGTFLKNGENGLLNKDLACVLINMDITHGERRYRKYTDKEQDGYCPSDNRHAGISSRRGGESASLLRCC